MGDQDRLYYEQRARHERELATACGQSSSGVIHLQLAEAYEQRLRQIQRIDELADMPHQHAG